MRLLRFFIVLGGAFITVLSVAKTPSGLAKALAKARMPKAGWSAMVLPLEGKKPVFSIGAQKLRSPASVTKVITSIVALDVLGSSFSWHTDFLQKGDTLYIKGGGDPHLVLEDLWLLLQSLRARGVDEVKHIVVDASYFKVGKQDLLDSDTRRAYLARPYAFLINFNAVNIRFIPDSKNKKVRVQISPHFYGLSVRPPAFAKGRCGNWRKKIRVRRIQWPDRLVFNGTYAARCGEKSMTLRAYPLNNLEYFKYIFYDMWPRLGGGGVPDVREGKIPVDARVIYRHHSKDLGQQLRYINKYSNNVMAQHLFLSLSAGKKSGTAEKSRQIVANWLVDKGFKDIQLYNGSGLTRKNRLSVASLAKLLKQYWSTPNMPNLVASLPQIGRDGSMRKRLRRAPYKGMGFIKTGRLNNVSSIAGYVQSGSGKWYVVVSILNAKGAEDAQSVHDALLRWVYHLPSTSNGYAF